MSCRCFLFLVSLLIFLVPLRALRGARVSSSMSKEEEDHVAVLSDITAKQTLAVFFHILISFAEVVSLILCLTQRTFNGFTNTLIVTECLANAGLLVLCSGTLRRGSCGDGVASASERERCERHRASSEAYQPCEDADWQQIVEDLACRGITLECLLTFYKGLAETMPHFDPHLHTTMDVVREVVIPGSAAERCGFASKMMGGRPLRPKRMVTHNWSNLFRDLVAAIVADALQQSSFSLIADLLDTDMSALEQMLGPEALAMSYWVCAFSVNQHFSICNVNLEGSRDPVTGESHPVCDCGSVKYFNDTPPLRNDGKGIRCEMNKFQDMIAFLSATDAEFAQVIAVDRDFNLFNRAWCVAELAEASRMGMQQHMKLVSKEALDERRERLDGLDVQHMKAARPEDAQEILSKIPDVTAFNAHLHDMLFGSQGLFFTWAKLDLIEQAAEIARFALLVARCNSFEPVTQKRTHKDMIGEESCGNAGKLNSVV